jgi:hypothetical protein
MMPEKYRVGNVLLKTNGPLKLWEAEKGLVKVDEGSLALPILVGEQRKGYVFHGVGRLILDAIVETDAGAIGKPVEKELNQLFLMLSNDEEMRENLQPASDEDLKTKGYQSLEEFAKRAEDLLDRFPRKRIIGCRDLGGHKGSIFLFQSESGKPDLLLLNGSRLVYKSSGTMFALSGRHVVLKGHDRVAVSVDGKCFVINR